MNIDIITVSSYRPFLFSIIILIHYKQMIIPPIL